MDLYQSAQHLYKDLTARADEIRPNVPRNYGVAAPPLVFATLAACAEGEIDRCSAPQRGLYFINIIAAGRLAVPAMDIYASFDDALQKGTLKASQLNMSSLAELGEKMLNLLFTCLRSTFALYLSVVRATTSEDFVQVVPQFLQSLVSQLHTVFFSFLLMYSVFGSRRDLRRAVSCSRVNCWQ